MTATEPGIAVIGAGVGGLALAAALAAEGVPVRVFEQAAAFHRVGTGIGVAPNAVKALAPLGIVGRLREAAYHAPYRSNRVWDTGRETSRITVGDEMERKYGAPYLLLHRGDLHTALYESVAASVRFGCRLEHLEERADGVRLRLADGSTYEAGIVVGADGAHSAVRESLFGSRAAVYSGRVAYRSVFPRDLLPGPLLDPHTKWWGRDRHIVIYYISGGREVYFTTSVPHEKWATESFSMTADVSEVVAAFDGFHPAVLAVLRACPVVHKWAIYEDQPLPSWHSGRVVLLGDACHPMTPYMQQGAATAIEDAVVLARCLSRVPGIGREPALRAYQQARKERASKIQVESAKNRWNRDGAGSPAITHEFVYSYDAWSVPVAA